MNIIEEMTEHLGNRVHSKAKYSDKITEELRLVVSYLECIHSEIIYSQKAQASKIYAHENLSGYGSHLVCSCISINRA